jgi:hypothetical protein
MELAEADEPRPKSYPRCAVFARGARQRSAWGPLGVARSFSVWPPWSTGKADIVAAPILRPGDG